MKTQYALRQSMKKNSFRFPISLLLLLSISPMLFANENVSYEEFLRNEQQQFKQSIEDVQQSSEREKKAFLSAVSSEEKEFIAALAEEWEAFQLHQGISRKSPKKPTSQPYKGIQPNNVNIISKINNALFTEYTKPENDSFFFYGHQISLSNNMIDQWPLLKSIDEDSIAAFWQNLVQTEIDIILQDIRDFQLKLELSDWATWQFVEQYAKSIYQDPNDQQALRWFLMNRLGYQARIARMGDNLVVLLNTKQVVYGRPYFYIGKTRFYLIDTQPVAKEEKVYSYNSDLHLTNKARAMDLNFQHSLLTIPDIQTRKIQYQYSGKEHELNVPFDLQRIRYLSTHPQIELNYYFEATMDNVTLQFLRNELSQEIASGNIETQINQLLRFVQTGFQYAVDTEQFGEENYLLPEELFFYDASDCEDRSFLFARLVKDLVSRKVVGALYPNHVATAIDISNTNSGTFIIADPTYAGARLGEILPEYRHVQPQYIGM